MTTDNNEFPNDLYVVVKLEPDECSILYMSSLCEECMSAIAEEIESRAGTFNAYAYDHESLFVVSLNGKQAKIEYYIGGVVLTPERIASMFELIGKRFEFLGAIAKVGG